MLAKSSRRWKMSAALLVCTSVSVIVLAGHINWPNSGLDSGETHAATVIAPEAYEAYEAYEGYVGHYKLNDTTIITVLRGGAQLWVRVTGQPQATL